MTTSISAKDALNMILWISESARIIPIDTNNLWIEWLEWKDVYRISVNDKEKWIKIFPFLVDLFWPILFETFPNCKMPKSSNDWNSFMEMKRDTNKFKNQFATEYISWDFTDTTDIIVVSKWSKIEWFIASHQKDIKWIWKCLYIDLTAVRWDIRTKINWNPEERSSSQRIWSKLYELLEATLDPDLIAWVTIDPWVYKARKRALEKKWFVTYLDWHKGWDSNALLNRRELNLLTRVRNELVYPVYGLKYPQKWIWEWQIAYKSSWFNRLTQSEVDTLEDWDLVKNTFQQLHDVWYDKWKVVYWQLYSIWPRLKRKLLAC